MNRKLLLFTCLCTTSLLLFAQQQTNADALPAHATVSVSTFVPKGDMRLVGVWSNAQKDYAIVFLADGRTASFNHKFDNYTESDSHVTIELGNYSVEGNKVAYEWLISGNQTEYFEGAGNELRFFTSLQSPYKIPVYRVAGADQAAAYYDQLYQQRLASAKSFSTNIPTGIAKQGPLQLEPYYNHDPSPTDIFRGAAVYTVYAKYSWVEGNHTYTRTSPDDPGITFQSFILMPNGRFIYDAWLHGFLAFDNIPNAEPRNDQERRDRTVSVRHYQLFGKYRIITQGDLLQGDTVELVYSDGTRKTVRIVSGRQYMRVPGSGVNFINLDYSKLEQARRNKR